MPEQVSSILFFDIKGYAQLRDGEVRAVHERLFPNLTKSIAHLTDQFEYFNSWADSTIIISFKAGVLAEVSFIIRDYFRKENLYKIFSTDAPPALSPRIGVYVGLVDFVEEVHPISGNLDKLHYTNKPFGINAIKGRWPKPLVTPGAVWITDQFRALIEEQISSEGGPYEVFALGEREIAIGYGKEKIWCLFRKGEGVSFDDHSTNLDQADSGINSERDFYLDNINIEISENSTSIKDRLRINKESLILVASLVLIEVEDFRERIRRDNKLDPDSKQKLFEILDEISNGMEEVLEFTPGEDQEDSEVDSSQALEWFSKYRTSFSNKLDEVLDPTLLGETSVPLSIILGCGAIGTLIGGAVGLGAGSVLGHLIARQLKPGQAADKLKDILSNDNDGNIDSREDT